MASVNYTTPWGRTRSVPEDSFAVARSGSYFYVLLGKSGKYYAGFNSPTASRTTTKDSLSEANAWIEGLRKVYLPEPEVPPTPTAPLPAYFAVSSNPSGASIYLDSSSTGKKTSASIEASPGQHSVGVSLSGYNSAVKTATAKAGTSTGVSFTLSKIPTAPTPTPEVPKAETIFGLPAPDWLTQMNAGWLEFWKPVTEHPWVVAYNKAIDAIADTFGVPIITPSGGTKKVIIIAAATAPQVLPQMSAATAEQVSAAGVNQAAAQIRSAATTAPNSIKTWLHSLTKEQAANLFTNLQTTTAGRAALETIQRVSLGSAAQLTKWKILQYATGAAVGLFGLASTLNFLGFLSEEAIQTQGVGVFTQVSNKLWPEAAESIKDYKKSVNATVAGVDALAAIPILSVFLNAWWPGYRTSALKQVEDYETTIAAKIAEEAPAVGPEVPAEVPSNAGRLQVLVYDAQTNTAINATLVIDGVSQPYHLHAYNIDLAPGPHEIRVEEEGYNRYDDTITIEAKKVMPINVFLEKPAPVEVPGPEVVPPEEVPPAATVGSVQITCNVEAEIWSAGIDTGAVTPIRIDLSPGIYDITLTAEGYITETKSAYVKAGEVYSLAFLLASETAGAAVKQAWRLDIDSSPSGAKILINYAFTSKYTPDYVLLDPGQYVVSLTKSGYQRWEQAVSLQEF